MCRSSDNFSRPTQLPLSPAVKALALAHTPDFNRSTAINFVHVNGRSLYTVDRRMVVVEGGMSYAL